jgi:hypothetical protein
MGIDWYETFKQWAKPPSDTEETKASNAARMINDAVRETKILDGRRFSVYPTGSYRNNTNIRANSDVDVAIVLEEAFWYTLPANVTAAQVGIATGTVGYGLGEFRADLHRALAKQFGVDVKPGNKTFDISGNSYRLPADATPFLLHRTYTLAADGSWQYRVGVETRPASDANKRIINWHQEHYDNGVAKNRSTNRRFKRVTRILKRMRDHMMGSGTSEAKAAAGPIASFLLECLVYNAPESCFNKQEGSYYDDVKAVITHMWNETKDDARASKLQEVNEQKALFGLHQGWARAQVHEFLLRAWGHAEFKS